MALTVTRTIVCPLACKDGEGVAVGNWSKGTARITCCDKCKGGSFTVKFTEMDLYLPAPVVTSWQHRDGLVVFA